MGVITTGSIPRLLQDGINTVFGQAYNKHERQWDKIFDTSSSRKAFELDVQLGGFGLASAKSEGDDIPMDSTRQGFTPKYRHITFAKGFIMTKEALQDELYSQFMRQARALAFSLNQIKEVTGANVLNEAFNPSSVMIDGDGKPLLATDHPHGPYGGSFSNMLPVGAALSEASLEDLLIQINEAVDSRGLKIALQGICLVVPPALMFEAQRILGSTLQNDTANNATNAMRDMNSLRDGFVKNNYLTNSAAWFVKTNAPDGLKHFTRQAVEFGQDNAFTSGNARNKADERYSFGWTDPLGIYGSSGPS